MWLSMSEQTVEMVEHFISVKLEIEILTTNQYFLVIN